MFEALTPNPCFPPQSTKAYFDQDIRCRCKLHPSTKIRVNLRIGVIYQTRNNRQMRLELNFRKVNCNIVDSYLDVEQNECTSCRENTRSVPKLVKNVGVAEAC